MTFHVYPGCPNTCNGVTCVQPGRRQKPRVFSAGYSDASWCILNIKHLVVQILEWVCVWTTCMTLNIRDSRTTYWCPDSRRRTLDTGGGTPGTLCTPHCCFGGWGARDRHVGNRMIEWKFGKDTGITGKIDRFWFSVGNTDIGTCLGFECIYTWVTTVPCTRSEVTRWCIRFR